MIMTQQDRELIIRLWNNRMSINKIVRMLPYKPTVARQYVKEVKESGALKAENRVPTQREIVVTAYKNGMTSPHEISETFDINYNCVQTYLKDAKLQRKRPPKNYKKRNAPERRQQIITAINGGKSNAEIAREFGVTRQWVFYIRKKYVDVGDCNE